MVDDSIAAAGVLFCVLLFGVFLGSVIKEIKKKKESKKEVKDQDIIDGQINYRGKIIPAFLRSVEEEAFAAFTKANLVISAIDECLTTLPKLYPSQEYHAFICWRGVKIGTATIVKGYLDTFVLKVYGSREYKREEIILDYLREFYPSAFHTLRQNEELRESLYNVPPFNEFGDITKYRKEWIEHIVNKGEYIRSELDWGVYGSRPNESERNVFLFVKNDSPVLNSLTASSPSEMYDHYRESRSKLTEALDKELIGGLPFFDLTIGDYLSEEAMGKFSVYDLGKGRVISLCPTVGNIRTAELLLEKEGFHVIVKLEEPRYEVDHTRLQLEFSAKLTDFFRNYGVPVNIEEKWQVATLTESVSDGLYRHIHGDHRHTLDFSYRVTPIEPKAVDLDKVK